MRPDDSFADVMNRLRAGDDAAAADVFARFTHRLVALARSHLDSRLRVMADPEDVIQSVFKSFFLHQAKGERPTWGGWDGLWTLLALITVRKCGHRVRHFHAARRDVRAEVAAPESDDSGTMEAFSDAPSPEEAAMLSEVVEQLLRNLGNRDGEILTLALQGYSAAEIGDQLNRPLRTVYNVLKRIQKRLEAQRDTSA